MPDNDRLTLSIVLMDSLLEKARVVKVPEGGSFDVKTFINMAVSRLT